MAVNPMQRKSRNSFLLGIIITLLITGIIIVMLFLQLKKKNDELQAEIGAKRIVYVLNQDVQSGQVLTQDMFVQKAININEIPSNATSVLEVIDSWYLQTKEGDMVARDQLGLYINKPDSIIEIYPVTEQDKEENATLEIGGYYRIENGEKVSITLRGNPYSDDEGLFIIDTNEQDLITRIYPEVTEGFYCYKLDPATNYKSRIKVEVKTTNVAVLAKVNMNANTVITRDLVVQSDEKITDDVRKVQYNMIILPMDLMTDEYIDIRLMLPNGQNFVVVSKKQVEIPQNQDGTYVADTIMMNLREDELLALSSAIVEAYGVEGSKLYAVKYAEPGLQEAAIPTYVPNNAVTAQIDSNRDGMIDNDNNNQMDNGDNPNIVSEAIRGLRERYTDAARNLRNQYIQTEINNETSYESNVESGINEEITNTEDVRKKYLESLNY